MEKSEEIFELTNFRIDEFKTQRADGAERVSLRHFENSTIRQSS